MIKEHRVYPGRMKQALEIPGNEAKLTVAPSDSHSLHHRAKWLLSEKLTK